MKKIKSYLFTAAVLTFLFSLLPTHTLAQETIINRLEKKLDVKLPNDYETKVKEFLDTCFWNVESKDNNTVRDIKRRMQNFTEQLIVEQMKNDWGIDRQNQLLFIWDVIIEQTSGKDIYDGEDGDNKKLQDFEKTIDNIDACGEKYKNGIIPLIKERSADAQRRSADAQRRSADAQRRSADAQRRSADAQQRSAEYEKQIAEIKERLKKGEEYLKELKERNKMTKDRIMHLDSIGIKNMAEIYIVYTSYSDIIDDGVLNIDRMKMSAEIFVDDCKKYRIDYKDILMKEVKTRVGLDDVKARRKVEEMLEFYGVQ